MGYLGWTPDVCLASDVNVLTLALEGRGEMLAAIFGGKEPAKSGKKRSTADFKAAFAAHNRQIARRGAHGGVGARAR
jgi:hypothetical protein